MIKAWINFLIHEAAAHWHGAVVAWRFNTGRLFVFRDRPDWFVRELAEDADAGRAAYPDAAGLIDQCCDEWRLRQRRGAS